MIEKEGKGKSVAEKVDSLGLNLGTLHMLAEVSLVVYIFKRTRLRLKLRMSLIQNYNVCH